MVTIENDVMTQLVELGESGIIKDGEGFQSMSQAAEWLNVKKDEFFKDHPDLEFPEISFLESLDKEEVQRLSDFAVNDIENISIEDYSRGNYQYDTIDVLHFLGDYRRDVTRANTIDFIYSPSLRDDESDNVNRISTALQDKASQVPEYKREQMILKEVPGIRGYLERLIPGGETGFNIEDKIIKDWGAGDKPFFEEDEIYK